MVDMSQVSYVAGSGATAGALASASGAEKNARLDASGRNESPTLKPRSCVVCRSRKVRCDKRAPCSNCRRANIACVRPPTDRPPRWARRLNPVNSTLSDPRVAQDTDIVGNRVMERLHSLENLVQKLRDQLEQAKSAANSAAGGSSGVGSPEGSTHDRQSNSSSVGTASVRDRFGRLVLQDSNQSRYISSGFWSIINDELNSLKTDVRGPAPGDIDSSDEELLENTPTTHELQQTPADRHGFLFGHNLNPYSPNPADLHPLPSQIPFMVDVFTENVNAIIQIVHLPTIKRTIRDWRGREMKGLTPANEALMFSIYYAAITSMEENDIILNFGATKAELSIKYRQGLEHALARADFLNVPDLVLVQAFTIFLTLARRHDSPRFIWMMTGLAIRMGQSLGLHRDGTQFSHLSPYEIEMRRRVWWVLCLLDVRASENQGTDYTITSASFDTKLPLNLNDADLDPESNEMPQSHDGLTDMSVARVTFGMCAVTRQMMAHGFKSEAPSLEEQGRLLQEIYQGLERDFLQYSVESGNITYWVIVTVARLVMAKMTLLTYMPLLFTSPNEEFSEELRTKLLVSAIEVAEYNHALNDEQACRHWRWVFQTYTHWYSIVYMMLEISRRPWSPLSEWAWVALHSDWLIPSQSRMEKNLRIWIPLKVLMAKARKHRDIEVARLKSDFEDVQKLEQVYHILPLPSSPGPFPSGSNSADLFLERWRQLVSTQENLKQDISTSDINYPGSTDSSIHHRNTTHGKPVPTPAVNNLRSAYTINSGNPQLAERQVGYDVSDTGSLNSLPFMLPDSSIGLGSDNHATSSNYFATAPEIQRDSQFASSAAVHSLWSDEGMSIGFTQMTEDPIGINLDVDDGVNWYSWVESAKDMETNSEPTGGGRV